MTEREAFEAWNEVHGRYRRRADAYEIVDGRYWQDAVQQSWEAWQASRQQFAEEAIDLVAFHGGSVEIEAAIRSLTSPIGDKA